MNKIIIALAIATLAPLAANAASPMLNNQSQYQQTVNGFGTLTPHETLSNGLQAPAYGAGQAG